MDWGGIHSRGTTSLHTPWWQFWCWCFNDSALHWHCTGSGSCVIYGGSPSLYSDATQHKTTYSTRYNGYSFTAMANPESCRTASTERSIPTKHHHHQEWIVSCSTPDMELYVSACFANFNTFNEEIMQALMDSSRVHTHCWASFTSLWLLCLHLVLIFYLILSAIDYCISSIWNFVYKG